MKTVVILIGNSDDKLSQKDWAGFYLHVYEFVSKYGTVHFSGTSIPVAIWQNACFVVEVSILSLSVIKQGLEELSTEYNQDSIAILVGDTEFI